jgi:hypothetical protein
VLPWRSVVFQKLSRAGIAVSSVINQRPVQFIRGFSVRMQEGEAGRAQEGAADRAERYRRNRQAVADPVVVRRRPHSRSKTEGRLGSESSIGANMSRRNICRHRTHPICQNQIGRPDRSSSSCPAGAGPAGRAGLRLQLQD